MAASFYRKKNMPSGRAVFLFGRLLPAGNKGFALLIVVVVMLFLSFLASQIVMQVRTELQVAANVKKNTVSRFLAEAGINLGIFRLLDKPVDTDAMADEKFHEGIVYETSLPTGTARYYVVNENGKIDLNTAPRELFELFFAHHDLDQEQIAVILDSLADWRDTDDFHRLLGAEQETYLAMDEPYIPRNGPISDPAEFFLINGTAGLAGKFAADQVFTVHNPMNKINFNSLTPEMLDFIVGGDEGMKEAYQSARKEYGDLPASQAEQILGPERFLLLSPYLSFVPGRNKNYFIVAEGLAGYSPDAETAAEDVTGMKISALVSVERSRYTYLAWREGSL